jgi:hypothetical protein
MAPVVCVAASQPLGRSTLNDGSLGGDILGPINPGAGNRVQAEQLKGASLADGSRRCGPAARLDVHFAGDTTAEVGLNNCVYTLKKL